MAKKYIQVGTQRQAEPLQRQAENGDYQLYNGP